MGTVRLPVVAVEAAARAMRASCLPDHIAAAMAEQEPHGSAFSTTPFELSDEEWNETSETQRQWLMKLARHGLAAGLGRMGITERQIVDAATRGDP
jgi:hypothetical protein